MHLRIILPAHLKRARELIVKATLGLAISLGMTAWFVALATLPAIALPAGDFHLRGTVRDPGNGNSLRAMDVLGRDGKVSGLVQLNSTLYAKDSQLWRERFPANGTIDHIKLENKLTGQCLADSVGDSAIATIRPCSDGTTIWQKIVLSGNRVVFQRTFRRAGFFSDIKVCLGKDFSNPDYLLTLTCTHGYTDVMIWEAYVSG